MVFLAGSAWAFDLVDFFPDIFVPPLRWFWLRRRDHRDATRQDSYLAGGKHIKRIVLEISGFSAVFEMWLIGVALLGGALGGSLAAPARDGLARRRSRWRTSRPAGSGWPRTPSCPS
jgi:hypothetical protein